MNYSRSRLRWSVFALLGLLATSAGFLTPHRIQAVSIDPIALPIAQVDTSYSTELMLHEATSTSLTWNITHGSLPANLVLEPTDTQGEMRIYGIPREEGTFSFDVQLMNGTTVVYEQPFSLAVWGEMGTNNVILFPIAKVSTPFSYTLPTLSGYSPLTWTLTSGQLPSGLALSPSGIITGTPTATTTAQFTLQSTDTLGRVNSYPLTLVVEPSVLAVTTDSLPVAQAGTQYSTVLTATGGIDGRSWTLVSGNLPTGVTLDANGRLQGTPLVAGDYPLTFRLQDGNGATIERAFTLTVDPANTNGSTQNPVITTRSFSPGMVGTLYSSPLLATGGTGPYSWRVANGILPSGIQLGSTGSLAGTPTIPGVYSFTLEATDAQNRQVTLPYQLVIQPQATTNDMERDIRLQTLQQLGLNVHDLIKLPDDRNASTQTDSAVYYLGTDGRRHAFPNERVFFTWRGNFLGVRTINASAMAQIPLGANVTYKPGTRLVKFPSDNRVYAVSSHRTLRWVPNESLAETLYGSNWRQDVDDIVSAFMSDYTFGSQISSSADYSPSAAQQSVSSISDALSSS